MHKLAAVTYNNHAVTVLSLWLFNRPLFLIINVPGVMPVTKCKINAQQLSKTDIYEKSIVIN